MGRKTKVILQPVKFRRREHIAILSPNSAEVDEVVRDFEGVEWSTGYRFWHMPLKADTIREIGEALKNIAVIDSSAFKNYEFEEKPEKKERRKRIRTEKPSEEQQAKLEQFSKSFLNKGYSEGTVKVYISMLNVFFGWFKNKDDKDISEGDINRFLAEYIDANNFTTNYKRLMTNSLRRYFEFAGRTDLHIS
jgi:hypothetical protein